MYRTDKEFMRNPATKACRVYIGSVAKTTITADLENIFGKHGTITGLTLNSGLGFAFVQYENESEAHVAIKAENGTMLNGRKIVVKQALDKSKPAGNQGGPGAPGAPRPLITPQKPTGPPPPQSRNLPAKDVPNKTQPSPEITPPSPKPDSTPAKLHQEEFQDENMEDERPNIRPPPGPLFNDDGRGRKPGRQNIGNSGGMGGTRRGGSRGHSNDRERFDRYGDGPRNRDHREGLRFEPPPDSYRERDSFYDRGNYGPPGRIEPFVPPVPDVDAPPPAAEKNDCEIIVVSKALTEYAEFIESKLKNLGLIVDLLFPNEDVPIGKVLANISSRGCLYAILVMPINEEHRSLTLNILHGIPQEHRNMPIEDAMILMSRNFEAYMKGEHLPADDLAQMTLFDRHPTPIQLLINLLAVNRQITSPQYDHLIKYLQLKKELQQEYEIAEGITPETQEGDPKQAELQNRILNILNKSNDNSIPTSITGPDPQSKNDAPILKDPTVQKALDSLMLGDMFKNIAGTVQ